MSSRLPKASLVEVKIMTLYVTETAKIKNMYESNHLLTNLNYAMITRIQFGEEVGENND